MAAHKDIFDPALRVMGRGVVAVFGPVSPGQFFRGSVVFGALLGFAIYLLARKAKKPRMPALSVSAGAGSIGDAFVDAGQKIGAFVRGVVFIGVGAASVAAELWWWQDIKPSGTDIFGLNDSIAMIGKIAQVLFYVCAAVFIFMGLREWRAVFKRPPRLKNQEA